MTDLNTTYGKYSLLRSMEVSMPVISKWQIKMIRLTHLEASLNCPNSVTQWLYVFLTVIGFQKSDNRLLVSSSWMSRPSHGLPWCVCTEKTRGDSSCPVLEGLYSLRGCHMSNDARIRVSVYHMCSVDKQILSS